MPVVVSSRYFKQKKVRALYPRHEGQDFTTHRIKITYQPLPFSIYPLGYYLILSLARL